MPAHSGQVPPRSPGPGGGPAGWRSRGSRRHHRSTSEPLRDRKEQRPEGKLHGRGRAGVSPSRGWRRRISGRQDFPQPAGIRGEHGPLRAPQYFPGITAPLRLHASTGKRCALPRSTRSYRGALCRRSSGLLSARPHGEIAVCV